MAMTAEAFRERVERLYREVTGAEATRGAAAWFGRESGVHSSTVRRYFSGELAVPERAAAFLRRLEVDTAEAIRQNADARILAIVNGATGDPGSP